MKKQQQYIAWDKTGMSQLLSKLKFLSSLWKLGCCGTKMEKSFKRRVGRACLVCGPKQLTSTKVLLALEEHSENKFILCPKCFSRTLTEEPGNDGELRLCPESRWWWEQLLLCKLLELIHLRPFLCLNCVLKSQIEPQKLMSVLLVVSNPPYFIKEGQDSA